jgi:hypothetical protein
VVSVGGFSTLCHFAISDLPGVEVRMEVSVDVSSARNRCRCVHICGRIQIRNCRLSSETVRIILNMTVGFKLCRHFQHASSHHSILSLHLFSHSREVIKTQIQIPNDR